MTTPHPEGAETRTTALAPKDSAPSVLSSWARTIVDALAAANVDVNAVLAAAGIPAEALRDPNARLPMQGTARLWKEAVRCTGDPAFALRATRHVRQTTFHALGYAVFASATLRDALHRLLRYSELVSDAVELVLETSDAAARLSFEVPPGVDPPSEEAIDAVTSLIVRTCRTLTDRSFSLLSVEQRRPEPDDPTPYFRFFRCPIVFGAAADAVTFDPEVLDRPLPTSNPELASHNDDLVRRYIAGMRQESTADRVRRALVERLSGDVSPAAVAAALGMSVRSLQRRLGEQGLTYLGVLNETRRELSRAYLRDSRYSITEVAFLLGFDDASAFARAFRRWTGLSPSAYRGQVSGELRIDRGAG
jgi:AraC-like DNA-binding protein